MKYVVDIDKPPIGPPGRIVKCSFFGGEIETKKSKQERANYEVYILEYTQAMHNHYKKD